MKHFLSVLAVALLSVGCSKENDEPDYPQARHTVIVYMIAENSLSDFVSYDRGEDDRGDIEEMVRGSESIPADCNLLVYLDKAGGTPQESQPKLMRIHDGQAEVLKVYPEQDSCNEGVFSSFLRQVKRDYPSESYSLVMWSHGTGWVPAQPKPKRSIGIDNNENSLSNRGSEMDIEAMSDAIEDAGMHFNWIMFDACFMQCVEVDYELKDEADYIIASPAEIPANGAPYDVIMPHLFVQDGARAASLIADSYFDCYKDNGGLVISVVRTAGLEALADATSLLWAGLKPVDSNDPTVQPYGPWNGRPEFYDMASVIARQTGSQAYSRWYSQLSRTVTTVRFTGTWKTGYYFDARIIDPDHIAGVSMFVPAPRYDSYGYNEAFRHTEWWDDVAE